MSLIRIAYVLWHVLIHTSERGHRCRATVSEHDEVQSDWNHRLAEWQAGRAIRCQECRQIELPGEPWHVCTNPNPPIRATVRRQRGG